MKRASGQHLVGFGIRIAVSAEVPACIVRAYVTGQIACAFSTRAFSIGSIQSFPYRKLIIADPHTSAAVRSELSKLVTFGAGLDGHAAGGCDLDHLSAEDDAVRLCYLARLREISPHFGIQVNKTYHGSFCVPIQRFRDFPKRPEVVFNSVLI